MQTTSLRQLALDGIVVLGTTPVALVGLASDPLGGMVAAVATA